MKFYQDYLLLTPKFDMLKTLSIGRTQQLSVFEVSLNDIIRNYSTDSVKDVAQEILDYIHNKKTDNETPKEVIPATEDTSAANNKLFSYLPDTLHNVILIFQNIGGPLDPDGLKNKISDFNSKNFNSKNLELQDLLFDHRNKIFVLRSFKNKQDALQYSSLFNNNDDVFGNVNTDAYQIYVISVNNLSLLLKLKATDKYEDFYRDFYR